MSSDIQSTFIQAAVASATAISLAAEVANNASLVLIGGSPFTLDAARKISVSSAGADSGISFTIVGLDHCGEPITESLQGADAATIASANYYSSVTSITAVGDPAGTVSAGTNAAVAAPMFEGRMRLRGMYAVNSSVQGIIDFRATSPTGELRMRFETLGEPTTAEYPDIPGDGMLFVGGGYVVYNAEELSSITVFYA
tara:strand:+ start:703 stop:1296 length:594 start_codon:yes stop_codon:yes gene_type:complete